MEKQQWLNLIESFEVSNLYEMFVVDSIVQEDGSVYSCRMQNLALKDAIISGEEFQSAVDVINFFNYYQLVDKPTLRAGQTFSTSIDSPIYRITQELNQSYNKMNFWEILLECGD